MHRRIPDLLALAFLALLALIFFWLVTLNLAWIPRGGGDLVSFLWPTYSYAAQSLRAGRLPLWNNTLYSGAPFAADNQSGLFYPINLLTFLLAPSLSYRAMEWLVVFHFWLAGASMYFLMRVLLAEPPSSVARSGRPASTLPALFASVAYMFSDVFITHVGNLNIVAVSAWLPAAFALFHLGLTRRSAGWAAGAGVVLGVAALAGHAQMTLMLAGALGLYGLWRIAYGVFRFPHATRHTQYAARFTFYASRSTLHLLALTALTFLIAFGLSAVSFIPAVEMLRHTARLRLDYASAARYSLPWAGLAGFFSPLIFGRGPAFFWAPWDRVELGYLGMLPLLFAGCAPFKNRRGVPLFMALLGACGLLVALGANTPVHWLLYSVVPGFAQLRVPARFILLTDFSLAVLAGLGLYHLREVTPRRMWLWGGALLAIALAAMFLGYQSAVAKTGTPHAASLNLGVALSIGLLLAGLALIAFKPLRRAAPVLTLAFLAADLIGLGAWVEVDRSDPTAGYQRQSAIAFLQSQPGPTRMDSASGAWQPDAAAMFGLEDIGGLYNPLGLAAYQTYAGAVGARGTPLYNFLNAQFVVADKNHPPADYTFVPVFNEDPAVDVYLNTQALPRATLVYSATVVPDGEAAFAAIQAPGFDPVSTVVAEGLTAPERPAGIPAGESNLYYLHYAPESFSVVAVTPAPAYLVFSEVWYPGWRAWVDGVEVPIFRANFAFRGVVLSSAGEHVVAMKFEPLSFKVGAGITLFTLACLLLWLALRVRSWRSIVHRPESG